MSMRTISRSIKKGVLRHVAFLLILAVTIIGLVPSEAGAAVISADQANPVAMRGENIEKLKAVLERQEVAARLGDYGLTPAEVSGRLDQLTDQQVAELAAQADQINAGGDVVGILLTVILVIILVWVILRLLKYDDIRLQHKDKSTT